MNWKTGLNFYSSKLCIFNPSDLTETQVRNEIESDKYHIYLICKRKKIHYDNTEEKDGVGYTTLFYLNDTLDKEYIKYKHSLSELKINYVKDGYYNIDMETQKNIMVRDFVMINNFAFIMNDSI